MAKKVIEFDGVKYLYELVNHDLFTFTYVYSSKPKIRYRKKYFLFGPIVEVKEYEYLFDTNMDFESPYYSKEDVRQRFAYYINLLNRKKEIENGNIL